MFVSDHAELVGHHQRVVTDGEAGIAECGPHLAGVPEGLVAGALSVPRAGVSLLNVAATEVPLAEAFTYPGVASAYRHRPPYPDMVFDVLTGLITDTPRTVLDLGAGEGALARPLAARVDQVDAVDISAAMVSAGRRRPGGDAPNLRWIVGAAETAPLDGPYALVTAGASMHWMRWQETFERLAAVMTDGSFLAIVGHGHEDPPWEAELNEIIARHSRSPKFDPSSRLVDALSATGLFETAGQVTTGPTPFRQRTGDYVEYLHSTSSLAREWMAPEEAADFDRAATEVTAAYELAGWLDMTVVANVTWGTVHAG